MNDENIEAPPAEGGETPTPRTDEIEEQDACGFEVSWEDHSRILETELTASDALVRELVGALTESLRLIGWAEHQFGDGDFDRLDDRNNFLAMESSIHASESALSSARQRGGSSE